MYNIKHKFMDDLEILENNQIFCNRSIREFPKLLIIGTFNPSDDSCLKINNSAWFYGRKKNNLWRYLPKSLNHHSLHQNDFHSDDYVKAWKRFCTLKGVIIVDLIKSIKGSTILSNFGDRNVNRLICEDLSNVEIFDFIKAFEGHTFDKVLYSLKWSDSTIKNLRNIRNIVNKTLIQKKIVSSSDNIFYCKSPSRNDSFSSWEFSINQ